MNGVMAEGRVMLGEWDDRVMWGGRDGVGKGWYNGFMAE